MALHLDMHTAAKRAEEDRSPLLGSAQTETEQVDRIILTCFKVFVALAAFFLTTMAIATLDPQLAFISIVLITGLGGTIFIGSEKIVRIFPRSIYLWTPSYSQRTFASAAHRRTKFFSGWGAPTAPPRGRSRFASRNTSAEGGHVNRPTARGTKENMAVGGGHVNGPIAKGTKENVAVGGGHDRKTDTTPNGNVIPGSRRR